MSKFRNYVTIMGAMAIVSTLACAVPSRAGDLAGGESTKALRERAESAVRGKTIVYIPELLAAPLAKEWGVVIQAEAEHLGMKYVVRDPNWNPNAELQLVSAMVDEKPDVLVVQNPNVTILAKQLKRAEQAGIYVIQVNQVSNYKTDGFIGGEFHEIGTMLADEAIRQCGTGTKKSGEVQIIQGEPTAGVNVEETAAVVERLSKDPAIKIVSNQAADWDATKALALTNTVLQQHPNLCAIVGMWGIMTQGAAQAVKAAHKLDQVKIITSGEGARSDCDALQQGLFFKYVNYDARLQGHDIMQLVKFLLQSGVKPGTFKIADYSKAVWNDKNTGKGDACFDLPK